MDRKSMPARQSHSRPNGTGGQAGLPDFVKAGFQLTTVANEVLLLIDNGIWR